MAVSAPRQRAARLSFSAASKAFLLPAVLCLLLGAAPLFGQGGFEGPGIYEIVNKNSGKVVDLDRNDKTTVIQFESRGSDNQRWEFREAGGGWYYIVNTMNSKALEPAGSRKRSPVEGRLFRAAREQQWRLEKGRGGTALILHRSGLALDVPGDSKKNGVRLQVTSKNGSAAQRFLLKRVNFAAGFRRGTPASRREPGQPAAQTSGRYDPMRACHFAIQESARQRFGPGTYLVFYGEPKLWRQNGKTRVYGQADVHTAQGRHPVDYNCLGDPAAGRIEWSGIQSRGRED